MIITLLLISKGSHHATHGRRAYGMIFQLIGSRDGFPFSARPGDIELVVVLFS